jgi:spore coat polysaccharide biosynthesis protein SpsF
MESMILAILQARTSSSRLPNKVLRPILGKAMLLYQIERIQRSKMIDKLVVATSTDISDNSLEKLCKDNDVEVFRGNLNNVLDRYYQCANSYKPTHVVRLTGDCPVIDPRIIDLTIENHLLAESDYTSNTLPPTYPDGLDVEVIKFKILKKTWKYAKLPSELEHVTPYIRNHPKIKKFNLKCEKNLSNHRWTVDEREDFDFIEKIFLKLYPNNNKFDMYDILDLLKKYPEYKEKNYHIGRNEGAIKSIQQDERFLKNV